MAQSKNNIVIHGFSGKLGELIVFRQRGNKTYVSVAPRDSNLPPTADQLSLRSRFQHAVVYGTTVMADPLLKESYKQVGRERDGQSAYNVAIADFFNAPDIQEIDVTGYNGAAGSSIKIKVIDDFKVKAVTVKIENPDNSLVESGSAVQDGDGPNWVYTSTANNTEISGDKITITASDLPENLTQKETILN